MCAPTVIQSVREEISRRGFLTALGGAVAAAAVATPMAAQQKRKADFAKRCSGKTGLSEPELEACRAAYRKL